MAETKEKRYVSDNAQLMAEWNFEKNVGLTPADILQSSNKKVWWICEKGHEWQAIVGNRNKGTGCPYCYGRVAITGENDLQTVNPALAKEWNFEKNYGVLPSEVLPNSSKKVWWICRNGHEWEARIGTRNQGNNCPYCAGQKVLKVCLRLTIVLLIMLSKKIDRTYLRHLHPFYMQYWELALTLTLREMRLKLKI